MANEILYTTALNKINELIHINNAEKGVAYYCPECKKEFTLRKSGKTGKGSRRPHFSHKNPAPNCTPEGVLHYSFKMMLTDLLRKQKAENKPFTFNWSCGSCSHKNVGNLIERVTLIKDEHVLEKCRADIALIDKTEQVVAVIEIVVSHKPEESVVQYYKEKRIPLIQINLASDEDLNRIEEKAKNPDFVDFCLSPRCPDCTNYKIDRRLAHCWKQCHCFSPIEKYEIAVDSVFGRRMSLDFTDAEIDWMKSKANEIGFRIKIVENKDTKEKYPVFICENCERMKIKYARRQPRL